MLISRVTLYSNALEEMKDFYLNKLDFQLLDSSEVSFSIQVGESELEFRKNNSNTKPFIILLSIYRPISFLKQKNGQKRRSF